MWFIPATYFLAAGCTMKAARWSPRFHFNSIFVLCCPYIFCMLLNYTKIFLTLSCLKPEILTPLLLLLLLLVFGLILKYLIFYISWRWRWLTMITNFTCYHQPIIEPQLYSYTKKIEDFKHDCCFEWCWNSFFEI